MCTRHRRTNFRSRCTIEWPAVLMACAVGALLLLTSVRCEAADARMILNIMACESGFRSDAVGDDGISRGIAQFRKETFYEFAALAIVRKEWDYKKLGKPKWMNPRQQVFLLEWGLDHGYGRRWTCYRTLTEGKK